MVSLLLMLVTPFMLLAQKIDDQVAPSKFKSANIVGAVIALPGPDLANTQVGTVNDLIINEQGQVTYVVADFSKNANWSWWSGDGLYLVPANAFDAGGFDNNNKLALVISHSPTSKVPRLQSSDDIPNLIPSTSLQVTKLKQFTVVGTNNEKLGSIQDVVIDTAQKTVTYVAIAESSSPKGGNNLYAFPFNKLKFVYVDSQIFLSMSKQQFDTLPSFADNNWPENSIP